MGAERAPILIKVNKKIFRSEGPVEQTRKEEKKVIRRMGIMEA